MFSPTVPPLEAPDGETVSGRESTSVLVSWQAVENADRYTVTLTSTEGADQLGLCSSFYHTVSVDTTSLSVVVGQQNMLRAYTTYSITVIAESDVWPSGSSSDSEPVMATTTQTGICDN